PHPSAEPTSIDGETFEPRPIGFRKICLKLSNFSGCWIAALSFLTPEAGDEYLDSHRPRSARVRNDRLARDRGTLRRSYARGDHPEGLSDVSGDRSVPRRRRATCY